MYKYWPNFWAKNNGIDYIAITGSASLQDTPLLGEFGDTGNALKAGPRKQPGLANRSFAAPG